MRVGATIANLAWLASSVGASRRFQRALAAPEETQWAWLHAQLARHAASEYGRAHEFSAVRRYADFVARVPLCRYADVEPYITRMQGGEEGLLGSDPVTHLAPTSGSVGARKLIPFTSALSRGFDAAVAPWMINLAQQRPRIVGGPGYWSVSPMASDSESPSAIPIGFADDAEYLGGAKAWLVRQVMAVPASVRHARDEETFWNTTALALLRCVELRLISVWHPSFFELLLAHAETHWEALLSGIERDDWSRAQQLRAIGAREWWRWWPALQVLSCWGEQAAESGWRRLCAQAPQLLVQPKGLLATEGVVTVPYGEWHVLAITSHFFEFLDPETGDVRRAHELTVGAQYEVVLTNGAGLWRYRLGDLVECTGHLAATPTLRFLGRAEQVSDLRGEKLSEPFVAECLRSLWEGEMPPRVAILRAVDDDVVGRYDLVVSTDTAHTGALLTRIDDALRANPHYARARRLGQLAPPRLVLVDAEYAQRSMLVEAHGRSARLGDVKPRVLEGAFARKQL
ncbi:MAG: GH3 auxin-responsive promoter family protein [Gemmatimonadaceae bacterium]|nr:GH3 auxin-responsive promoter family protein [Gemmatimonadaceae bacterium]